MDVIMSTAFGIQTDFQNNPNDPVMQTATQFMNPNLVKRFLEQNVIPALPYGIEFLKSQLGKRLFFKKLFKVADIAQEVVEARKKGAVRKVSKSYERQYASACALHKMFCNWVQFHEV